MNKSSKEYSTYDSSTIQLPPFHMWVKTLQSNSRKYERYGSFLPLQEKLLGQIHLALSGSKSKAVGFTAPPASGKTHVITLCASYFHDLSLPTCIVTPNNELKFEFQEELGDVNRHSKEILPILNLGALVRRRNQFDFVFVDEAHNLRSAVELDKDIVRSFHFEKGGPLYEDIARLLESDQGYRTKELNIESAHDILETIKGTEYDKEAQYVLRRLSQWRGFCIVSDRTCELKFLAADPSKRNFAPRGRLLLFSATLLDQDELAFYCSIPECFIQESVDKQDDFVAKKNVTYCYTVCRSEIEKKEFTISLLKDTELTTLILVNSNSACLDWSQSFPENIRDRVITVQSGHPYLERMKLYKKFCDRPAQVLLTSSSVYWEGLSIKDLKLLIIPSPPYPQPTLLEIAQGRHTQYRKIAKRRLIQGIGRIGRSPLMNGVCLLLFRPVSISDHFAYVTQEQAKATAQGVITKR